MDNKQTTNVFNTNFDNSKGLDFTNNDLNKLKGKSTNTVCLNDPTSQTSELNKSNYPTFGQGVKVNQSMVIPPYGFTLKQRESLMISGFPPTTESPIIKTTPSTLLANKHDVNIEKPAIVEASQDYSTSVSRTRALNGSKMPRNRSINPILLEALKK